MIDEVTGGLAATLKFTGVGTHDVLPARLTPPVIFIPPPRIDYQQTFQLGLVKMEYEPIVFVGSQWAENQKDLWPFMDPTGDRSVIAAVRADPRLGGTVMQDTVVHGCRPLGLEEFALYSYWGAAFPMTVWVRPTPPT